MISRLEVLRWEVDRLIRKNQPENDAYFFSHLYGVSNFCTLLAIKRNLNEEIAAACGMLHDIAVVLTGDSTQHGKRGAILAEPILRKLGLYTNEEIATITSAISKHSKKKAVHGAYDEVVKDADVMHHCMYDTSAPVSDKETTRYVSILDELGCTAVEHDAAFEQRLNSV
ncbi:MAG: HD domain-containing protein [Clostridiales bacterium]|nr:HD domain-containing protein [Clostridiales bacterium]